MSDAAFDALLRQVASAPATLEWALRPGVVVNERWEVAEELGRGGMGVVVRARDLVLGRDVALKFLDDAPTNASREATLAEARAAAAVHHPSIVSVYDVGETEDGRAFLAMELVDGPSLRATLSDGPLLPSACFDICESLASGLDAAWAADLVHGDLKPENILVPETGPAKILDFGLSTSSRGADAKRNPGAGTLLYMAPELLAGDERTKASDAFAFGAILYEMVTGTSAVRISGEGEGESDGDTPDGIRQRIVDNLPDNVPDNVPKDLREWGALALRLLSPDPKARLVEGGALSEMLPAPPAEKRSTALVGAVALLLVVVAASAFALSGRPLSMAAFRGEQAAAPSLQSLPALADQPRLQAKFRTAAEQWYAGEDEAAVRLLDEVLIAKPPPVGPLLLRLFAGHHELDGRNRDAIVQSLEEVGPQADEPWSAIAALVVALHGDTPSEDTIEQATDQLERLQGQGDGYFASLILARALSPHAPDIAAATFDVLLNQDPGPVRPALHLAWAHMRTGNEDQVRAAIDRALEQNPRNLSLLLARGQSELGRHQLSVAKSTFQEILKRDPGHLIARFAFAETLFLLGQEDAWRTELEAIAKGPYPPALLGKGIALHARLPWSRGAFERADAIFALGETILEDNQLLEPLLPLVFNRVRWALASENQAERKRAANALRRVGRRFERAPTQRDPSELHPAAPVQHLEAVARALEAEEGANALADSSGEFGSSAVAPDLGPAVVRRLIALSGRGQSDADSIRDTFDAAFASDPSGPLAQGGLFDLVLRARLLGEGPLATATGFDDAAKACAERTHFEHLWCRVVLANEARRRSRQQDDSDERARLEATAHKLAPALAKAAAAP